MHAADALALTLHEAGVRIATYVPGFGATQAAAAFVKLAPESRLSFHEEVAFSIAHGASFSGQRAAFFTKTHGLYKSANALADTLACGVGAALVVVAADDPVGAASDSVLEALPLVRALRLPHRTTDAARIAEDAAWAIGESERLALPVVLVVDAEQMLRESPGPAAVASEPRPFRRDPLRQVAAPALAQFQRRLLEAKLAGEDWRAIAPPSYPRVPDDLPPRFAGTVRSYVPLMQAFAQARGSFVAGDAGLTATFAFSPFDAIDVVAQMGGSVPLALGASLAGRRDAWAVTGDFSFIAAGHVGLVEAATRGADLKVLVVANGLASATGGQPVPDEALDVVLAGYAKRTTWTTGDDARAALAEAAASPGLRIVVARVPG